MICYKSIFLQVIMSLLNRDDVGLAKRIRFGGHDRLRVSINA